MLKNDICDIVLRSKRVLLFYVCVASRGFMLIFHIKETLEHSTCVPFSIVGSEKKYVCKLTLSLSFFFCFLFSVCSAISRDLRVCQAICELSGEFIEVIY